MNDTFLEDVARSMPKASVEDQHRDVYPQLENRQHVVSHLKREVVGFWQRSERFATTTSVRCVVCVSTMSTVPSSLTATQRTIT